MISVRADLFIDSILSVNKGAFFSCENVKLE